MHSIYILYIYFILLKVKNVCYIYFFKELMFTLVPCPMCFDVPRSVAKLSNISPLQFVFVRRHHNAKKL